MPIPQRSSPTSSKASPRTKKSTLLRTVGWVSAGLGALAVGLFVGRELRQRYKFNRRTPYDFLRPLRRRRPRPRVRRRRLAARVGSPGLESRDKTRKGGSPGLQSRDKAILSKGL